MRRVLLLAGMLVCMNALAQDATPGCRSVESFVAPQVPWIGQLIYKTSYKVRAGRAESVAVEAYQAADRNTNRLLIKELEKHISDQYRCTGQDRDVEEYFALNLAHDVPELAEQLREARAKNASWSAAREAAKAASAPFDLPAPASLICPHFGYPKMPNMSGEGVVKFHTVVEVRNGAIGIVDVKIMRGSPDPRVNKLFMDTIVDTIRGTYRCEGSAVFEQEFQFTMGRTEYH